MVDHTQRERVYAAVSSFWTVYGYAPTIREIASLCDLASTSTVRYHLLRLRAAGLVDWNDGTPRTLRVTA